MILFKNRRTHCNFWVVYSNINVLPKHRQTERPHICRRHQKVENHWSHRVLTQSWKSLSAAMLYYHSTDDTHDYSIACCVMWVCCDYHSLQIQVSLPPHVLDIRRVWTLYPNGVHKPQMNLKYIILLLYFLRNKTTHLLSPVLALYLFPSKYSDSWFK